MATSPHSLGSPIAEKPVSAAPADKVLQQSRTFVDRQADNVTSMLGEHVSAIAAELRRVDAELAASETGHPISGVTKHAADFAERIAGYLQNADGEQLVADAEALATRNPMVAAGAALIVGLSLSRFLKSSSRARRRPPDGDDSYGG
jgi:hypothetical protein